MKSPEKIEDLKEREVGSKEEELVAEAKQSYRQCAHRTLTQQIHHSQES